MLLDLRPLLDEEEQANVGIATAPTPRIITVYVDLVISWEIRAPVDARIGASWAVQHPVRADTSAVWSGRSHARVDIRSAWSVRYAVSAGTSMQLVPVAAELRARWFSESEDEFLIALDLI